MDNTENPTIHLIDVPNGQIPFAKSKGAFWDYDSQSLCVTDQTLQKEPIFQGWLQKDRLYLNTTPNDRDFLKKNGARYDPKQNKWYAPAFTNQKVFQSMVGVKEYDVQACINEFISFAERQCGIIIKDIKTDGAFHHAQLIDDKKSKQSASYAFHTNDGNFPPTAPQGILNNFKTGQMIKWSGRDIYNLNPNIQTPTVDYQARQQELAQKNQKDKIVTEQIHNERAKQISAYIMDKDKDFRKNLFSKKVQDFPYLNLKGIIERYRNPDYFDKDNDPRKLPLSEHAVSVVNKKINYIDKFTGEPKSFMSENLVIPLINIKDEIRSVQSIYVKNNNKTGEIEVHKILAKDAEKEGNFHVVGGKFGNIKDDSIIVLSEGYATACSVRALLKYTGNENAFSVSAVDSNNLPKVAKNFRDKFNNATIVIASDFDEAGLKAAKECAEIENGNFLYLQPPEPQIIQQLEYQMRNVPHLAGKHITDYNDLNSFSNVNREGFEIAANHFSNFFKDFNITQELPAEKQETSVEQNQKKIDETLSGNQPENTINQPLKETTMKTQNTVKYLTQSFNLTTYEKAQEAQENLLDIEREICNYIHSNNPNKNKYLNDPKKDPENRFHKAISDISNKITNENKEIICKEIKNNFAILKENNKNNEFNNELNFENQVEKMIKATKGLNIKIAFGKLETDTTPAIKFSKFSKNFENLDKQIFRLTLTATHAQRMPYPKIYKEKKYNNVYDSYIEKKLALIENGFLKQINTPTAQEKDIQKTIQATTKEIENLDKEITNFIDENKITKKLNDFLDLTDNIEAMIIPNKNEIYIKKELNEISLYPNTEAKNLFDETNRNIIWNNGALVMDYQQFLDSIEKTKTLQEKIINDSKLTSAEQENLKDLKNFLDNSFITEKQEKHTTNKTNKKINQIKNKPILLSYANDDIKKLYDHNEKILTIKKLFKIHKENNAFIIQKSSYEYKKNINTFHYVPDGWGTSPVNNSVMKNLNTLRKENPMSPIILQKKDFSDLSNYDVINLSTKKIIEIEKAIIKECKNLGVLYTNENVENITPQHFKKAENLIKSHLKTKEVSAKVAESIEKEKALKAEQTAKQAQKLESQQSKRSRGRGR